MNMKLRRICGGAINQVRAVSRRRLIGALGQLSTCAHAPTAVEVGSRSRAKYGLILMDFTARSRAAPDKQMLHAARALFKEIELPAMMIANQVQTVPG